ncbi:hypothetical protein [Paracoccus spongiarum]|uniref:Sugar transporter n=1 Tax=Paracoccus spongiarum TaxID=3064387 RepID=A0ABT9J7D9_9RHOB|nr:hypothetical protein [Paracoccus sp. 2205BS29-5]MDP5305696.1 hypothetical protein [Paracoccus sp. 2205BS29-5]
MSAPDRPGRLAQDAAADRLPADERRADDRPPEDQPRRPAFLDRPGPQGLAALRASAPEAEAEDRWTTATGNDGGAGASDADPDADPDGRAGSGGSRRNRRMRKNQRAAATAAPSPAATPAPAAPAPDPAPRSRAARRRGDDDDEADDAPASGADTRREKVRRRQAEREARRLARPQPAVRPPASRARFERRHLGLLLSFLLVVVTPVALSGWYLYARAVDQYASVLGFSVRSESGPSSSDLLGGLTSSLIGMTSSSSSDTDILYKFIQSRDLVERIDSRLDLRAIWSKAPGDPVFGYRGNDSLEDLLTEWERKVRVYYDNGMIDLRVLAFDPADARNVAQAILDESTVLINQLNDVAREDALRYSRTELDDALERLKLARQAVTEFRNRHQLVDPSADVQGQIGVVSSLQQQLAEELVALGLLRANAQPGDQRIEQAQLRISVIREQIEAERQKFGSETASGELLSDLVGQYESLSVDREFAERTYTAALAAHDTARAEAVRQSLYLAAYVKPTLAQEAEYPERAKLMLIIGGFLLLIWVVGLLVFYSLRDRR